MRITNHSVSVAIGKDKDLQLRALETGRQIARVIEDVQHVYGALGSRHVSVLELATGTWRSAVTVNFPAVDQAVKNAKELVKAVGGESTIEFQNNDMSVASLLTSAEQARDLLAPLRSALESKRSAL